MIPTIFHAFSYLVILMYILNIKIHLFPFLHTESDISPIRTREHTNTAEEPSTSGNDHSQHLPPTGILRRSQYRSNLKHKSIIPGTGLRGDTNYRDVEFVPGLYYIKQNHLAPLTGDYAAANRAGFMIGRIVDGYVRPIYNKNHQIVIVRENDRQIFVVTQEQAEAFGVNKPLPSSFMAPTH